MHQTTNKAEILITKVANQSSQLVVFLDIFVGGYPRGNAFGHKLTMGRKNYRKKFKALLKNLAFQMVQVD
jgi:beta-cyano-L-alanine hydratase/nitrilase